MLLPGLGLPSQLVRLCELESEVIWFLRSPEWPSVISGQFATVYSEARLLFHAIFPDDNSINQHNVCHVQSSLSQLGPPVSTDAQRPESYLGKLGKFCKNSSKWKCHFVLKRMSQIFSLAIWYYSFTNWITLTKR